MLHHIRKNNTKSWAYLNSRLAFTLPNYECSISVFCYFVFHWLSNNVVHYYYFWIYFMFNIQTPITEACICILCVSTFILVIKLVNKPKLNYFRNKLLLFTWLGIHKIIENCIWNGIMPSNQYFSMTTSALSVFYAFPTNKMRNLQQAYKNIYIKIFIFIYNVLLLLSLFISHH